MVDMWPSAGTRGTSSEFGHRTSHPDKLLHRHIASLSALLLVALVGLPTTHAAAQSPSPAPPQDSVVIEGGTATGGGLEDADLDGAGLGEETGEFGVADLLGPDGIYHLQDGEGTIPLRLLDTDEGTPAAAQAATGSGAANLSGLAVSAASAYAPVSGSGAQEASPSNWLVSDSGQMFLLVGGVNVVFESHLDQSEIWAILASHDVAPWHVSPVGELPNAYLVQTVSDVESLRLADALSTQSGVDFAVPNLFTPQSSGQNPISAWYRSGTRATKQRCKRYTKPWTDQLSSCLWHLNADTDFRYKAGGRVDNPTTDINLGDVWDTTMGAGVTVAVVDRTWEATHEDIKDNADTKRSKLWGGFTGENPLSPYPPHGTAVAGVIGARDNNVGGRGVAPRATLLNYNFLDHQSFGIEATALTLNKETVAVYNMSYGALDSKAPLRESSLVWRAVEEGISSGFGGKGSSYVNSAGNGAELSGKNWAGLDEMINHRGVIAVCAVDSQGRSSKYSEDGPSLWVCAPSDSKWRQAGIVAPMGLNSYTDRFGGTSAAAPIVSGVIALMRSVNANLTWRDVKVILANTAQKNDPSGSSWMSGATKYGSSTDSYSFSNEYGFGTVDAKAAVVAASNWPLLPAMLSAEAASGTDVSLPTPGNEIVMSLDISSTMDFVEHVRIDIDMDTYDIRDYSWTLVSPSGTESLLSPEFPACGGHCRMRGDFRFGSSRHLGESPLGTWKLKVRRHAPEVTHCGNSSTFDDLCRNILSFGEYIKNWKIMVTGHAGQSTQPVSLSVSPQSVTEGDEVDVSVTVGGAAPSQDLVVPLTLTAGTATGAGLSGADYAVLGSVTVPAGSSSASAKLATVEDGVDEVDETFTVGLGVLPSGYHATGGAATVTIVDDEPLPTIILSTDSATVAEGGSVTITADLSGPSSEDVALDVGASAVAPAVAGDGSLSASTTLTIAAGSTAGTGAVTFTASQNDLYELSSATAKTFKVSAAATGGNGVADPAAITITISDDESPPEVSISSGGDVAEGADAVFTLTASPAPASDLDVKVTVAVDGDFGVSPGSRTVTIPSSGSATLTLATTGDDTDESDGSVTVTIGPGVDYTPDSVSSASIAVADDDDPAPVVAPVVSVTAGNDVAEGSAARFTVTAVPAPAADLDVSVTVTTAGEYGVTTGRRTVTVTAGTGSATLTLPTAEDLIDEPDGSVTATVNTDSGYTISNSAGVATVKVSDNDDPLPTDGSLLLLLSADSGWVAEDGGEVRITISLSRALRNDKREAEWLRVPLEVSGGVEGVHWRLEMRHRDNPVGGIQFRRNGAQPSLLLYSGTQTANLVLTVPPNTDSRTITVGVGAGLRAPSLGSTGNSNPSVRVVVDSVSVDVGDDYPDLPLVSVSGGDTVSEGGDAVFTLSASPAPSAGLPVSVLVGQVGNFGASEGVRTVTIPTSGSVSFSVGTVDDTADELDGSVVATVNAGSGYTVGSPRRASVTVTDDEPTPVADPVVSVAAGSDVTEGSDAEFTVSASPAPIADLDVSVTISEVGDYGVTVGQRTVTIPTTGSASFSVTTAGDSADEPDGSVTATVNTGSGYTVSNIASTATVTVSDDDDPPVIPVVSVVAGSDVSEGSDAEFTVSASPAPIADLDVSVTVTEVGDYGVTVGQRTVTIPAGTNTATLTLPTTNDTADELNGTVTTTLNTGSGYTVSNIASTATVTVSDDDDPPVIPVVSVVAGSDVSEGSDAEFTVSASPAPTTDLDVSVTVTTVGDYGAVTGLRTVTIPPSGSVTLTVNTTGDQADEPDGSVTVTLVDGTDYDLGSPSAATVGVADDDIPEISISAGGDITEGTAAAFTITANPTPAANLDVSVTITSAGDYGAVTGLRTVTIPPSGSVTLTVNTTGDQADEPDGSVTATVNTGSGYTVSTTNGTATVTVSDDDDPPVEPDKDDEITVTVEDASATETDVLVFRILLSKALTEEFEVRWFAGPAYHLLDNRAHSSDYQAMSEVMVFAPGVTALTADVWLVQDSKDEPDEYFAVEAFLPGEWFTPAAVGTMTIIDDD